MREVSFMKSSLNTLAVWILSALIITVGHAPIAYPFDKQEKSVKGAPASSQTLIPKRISARSSGKKKKSPPFTERSIEGERSFSPIIIRTALRYDIDPALVMAIIMAESEYNPRAISLKGAMGLMQLMPVTARSLGVDDVFNPEQNIHAGVRHFKFLLKQLDGDVALALAAYNAGLKHVKRYKDIPPFKDTKQYLKKVFLYFKFYKERGVVIPVNGRDLTLDMEHRKKEP